jgi:hypothetical protein
MKHFLRSLGLVAALHYAVAVAAPERKAVETPSKGYDSPFESYRRFNADEPMKDWRAANEEVREAGGHIGLLKAAKSPDKAKGPTHPGHGAHGQGAKP